MNEIINGNLAVQAIATNEDTGCTNIMLTSVKQRPTNNSNYTSTGKRKKTPCDPIRKQEDIVKMKRYFLANGKTPQVRLRNHAIFVLGISIGVRGGDLLRLRISDVLGPDGEVMDEIRVFESKTRKAVYPFINETAKSALRMYIDSLQRYSYDDILFSQYSNRKEPMTTDNLCKLIANAGKALGLPYHLGSHSLRKTFAYWTINLHQNDLNTMISLQEMLNHSSMKTTLHYSGHTRDDVKPMYYDIDNIFSKDFNDKKEVKTDKTDKIYDLIQAIMSEE